MTSAPARPTVQLVIRREDQMEEIQDFIVAVNDLKARLPRAVRVDSSFASHPHTTAAFRFETCDQQEMFGKASLTFRPDQRFLDATPDSVRGRMIIVDFLDYSFTVEEAPHWPDPYSPDTAIEWLSLSIDFWLEGARHPARALYTLQGIALGQAGPYGEIATVLNVLRKADGLPSDPKAHFYLDGGFLSTNPSRDVAENLLTPSGQDAMLSIAPRLLSIHQGLSRNFNISPAAMFIPMDLTVTARESLDIIRRLPAGDGPFFLSTIEKAA